MSKINAIYFCSFIRTIFVELLYLLNEKNNNLPQRINEKSAKKEINVLENEDEGDKINLIEDDDADDKNKNDNKENNVTTIKNKE